MSKSKEHCLKTIEERNSRKKFRQERRDTAELREAFERQQYREQQALLSYLREKGEIE